MQAVECAKHTHTNTHTPTHTKRKKAKMKNRSAAGTQAAKHADDTSSRKHELDRALENTSWTAARVWWVVAAGKGHKHNKYLRTNATTSCATHTLEKKQEGLTANH